MYYTTLIDKPNGESYLISSTTLLSHAKHFVEARLKYTPARVKTGDNKAFYTTVVYTNYGIEISFVFTNVIARLHMKVALYGNEPTRIRLEPVVSVADKVIGWAVVHGDKKLGICQTEADIIYAVERMITTAFTEDLL